MADVQVDNQSFDNDSLSKIEKKNLKAMAKLGLEPVSGINRVVFRRPRGMMLAVQEPQVFRSADNATYVVLGDAKQEDLNLQAQQAAADRLRMVESQAQKEQEKQTEAAPEENEEEVDEEGVDQKDIDLVMTQTGVSRAKAVKALRDNGLDLVNTIMLIATN